MVLNVEWMNKMEQEQEQEEIYVMAYENNTHNFPLMPQQRKLCCMIMLIYTNEYRINIFMYRKWNEFEFFGGSFWGLLNNVVGV